METIKLFFVAFLMSVIAIPAICLGANGNESSQVRTVENFNAISVSSGIDLYLSQGTSHKVLVEADGDIIDDIITEVKDGTLQVYMKKRGSWGMKFWRKDSKVYVTFKDVEQIKASAGADVESDDLLKFENINIDSSSGSDVELEIKAKSVSLEASSGSDLNIAGVAESLEASSSSGSDINAGKLKVKFGKVKASSGSDAIVFVTEKIKANASSGADIVYYGKPAHKDINESSGGDVKGR